MEVIVPVTNDRFAIKGTSLPTINKSSQERIMIRRPYLRILLIGAILSGLLHGVISHITVWEVINSNFQFFVWPGIGAGILLHNLIRESINVQYDPLPPLVLWSAFFVNFIFWTGLFSGLIAGFKYVRKTDMSRTRKYKIIYFMIVLLASIAALFVVYQFKGNYYVIFFIVIFFLVPGRIQGYLYRDFFIGRKLVSRRKYDDALHHFKMFENKLAENKWLENAIWLAAFIYTKSIKVMTLNNIGVCYLELGELEKARIYLESALKLDEESPLPYYNLSIVSEIEGAHDLAVKLFNTSVKLGYSRTSIDKMIHKAGEIYAHIEGKKLRDRDSA